MRLNAAAVTLLAALAVAPAHSQPAPTRPFNPVGRWRFHHTDGTPFIARLTPDQSAATDWEGGEHGIWRWEGDKVRMIYTDGWDDLLVPGPGGAFSKRGAGVKRAESCGVVGGGVAARATGANGRQRARH